MISIRKNFILCLRFYKQYFFEVKNSMNQQDIKSQVSKGQTYEEIKNRWNKMSKTYTSIDSAPQTFYYSLCNMLKLNEAKNVLEIACGAGLLIPMVLDLKSPQTFYYATDISEQMIKFANLRLQSHFAKYQSKLTLDEWIKKQKLEFSVLNGEQPITKNVKFDRIICNLVLMLTNNAQKMLDNLYDSAQDGCLLGLTVWGDIEKNPFFKYVEQLNKQNPNIPPNFRSNFYLYQQIQELVEKYGWQKVLAWEQNSLFPVLKHNQTEIHRFLKDQVLMRFPENLQPKLLNKVNELINEKKCGLNFGCKLMIVRKKSK